MKNWRIVLIFLVLSCTDPLRAQEKTIVTWMLQDLPPASILINDRPTDGILDRLLGTIIRNWPEAEHRMLPANPNRTWSMIAAGEPVCAINGVRSPERERVAYFANAYLAPPLQLVVRKSFADRLPLNANGEVRLRLLLAQENTRGLSPEKRSYGQQIDTWLAAAPPTTGFRRFNPGSFGGHALVMIARDRADYTFEYDFVLAYQQKQDRDLAGLRSLPIENATAPLLAGVACPRNEWGRATITRVDQIIARHAPTAEYQDNFSRWLTPETLRRYYPAMQTFYQQRRQPTPASQFH